MFRRLLATFVCLSSTAPAQKPPGEKQPAAKPVPPATAPAASDPSAGLGVKFDARGWPVVSEVASQPEVDPIAPPARRNPATAATEPPTEPPAKPLADAAAASRRTSASAARVLASGVEPGSSLLAVFQATGTPGAFRALAGVTVWWRITVFGPQGEPIGLREITHIADAAQPDRDRLEQADGRLFGRSGATVFAERQGMPWPSLAESAAHQLQLFGEHLRLPFAFGDASAFAVVGTDEVRRGSEQVRRIQLERRPQGNDGLIGPRAAPPAVDSYDLLCDRSGLPCELVHRFVSSGQQRRVLLEDWRQVGEVKLPFRRTYVDESQRATTTMAILRVETGVTIADRDFRLR